MSYLDTVTDEKEKMTLLQTLLDTSEGKVALCCDDNADVSGGGACAPSS